MTDSAEVVAARRAGATEMRDTIAAWHDSEAGKLKARLDAANKRRNIPPTDIVIGGYHMSFSGNYVGELREALQNDIALHEMAAKAIRALTIA